jgi:transposase-like protein
MTRRRHTPEQIVRKLREADRLLGEGQDLAAGCRHLEVSEQTLHRWRAQYGGRKADDTKRLKELEKENSTWKRLLPTPSREGGVEGDRQGKLVSPVEPAPGRANAV